MWYVMAGHQLFLFAIILSIYGINGQTFHFQSRNRSPETPNVVQFNRFKSFQNEQPESRFLTNNNFTNPLLVRQEDQFRTNQGFQHQLTPEQQRVVKEQEDFRKSIADSNRIRSKNVQPFQNGEEAHFPVQNRQQVFEPILQPAIEVQKPQTSVEPTSQRLATPVLRKNPNKVMKFITLLGPTLTEDPKLKVPLAQFTPDDEEVVRKQAESAKYSFASSVNDQIMDHQHTRQETRDGLKLTGSYAYSDGFYKRTVHYVADENGYRITKEDSEPIGDGPQTNPTGVAEVSSNVGGTNLRYAITGQDSPFLTRRSASQRV